MNMNRAMVCTLTDLRNDIQMFKFQENHEPQEIKQIKSIVPSLRVPRRFSGSGICFIGIQIRARLKQNRG